MLGLGMAVFRIDMTASLAIASPHYDISIINSLKNQINPYHMRYTYVEVQYLPRSKHIWVAKTRKLKVLCMEIIAACSEIHAEDVNVLQTDCVIS